MVSPTSKEIGAPGASGRQPHVVGARRRSDGARAPAGGGARRSSRRTWQRRERGASARGGIANAAACWVNQGGTMTRWTCLLSSIAFVFAAGCSREQRAQRHEEEARS